MHIFGGERVEVCGIVFAGLANLRQCSSNLFSFGRLQHPGVNQRVAVCDTGHDVDCEQSAVKTERAIELREARICVTAEPATPQAAVICTCHMFFSKAALPCPAVDT